MHAVELEQMGVHFGRAKVIDRDEVEVLAAGFEEGPEREPADPAKAIDGDTLIRHFSSLFMTNETARGRPGLPPR